MRKCMGEKDDNWGMEVMTIMVYILSRLRMGDVGQQK